MRVYIAVLLLAVYLAVAQACGSCGGSTKHAVYHQQGCTTCRGRDQYDPSRYYERADAHCNSCSSEKKNTVQRCTVCRDMTKIHNERNKGGVVDVRAAWSENAWGSTSTATCPSGFKVVACRSEGKTDHPCLILEERCIARGPVVQAYAVCKKKTKKICGTWSAKCPPQYKMTSCVITLFGNVVAAERKVENMVKNTCQTITPINHAVTTIGCELSVKPADIITDPAVAPSAEPVPVAVDPNAVPVPTTENPFKEYYDYLWALYKWYTAQVQRGSGGGRRGCAAPQRRRRRGYGSGGYGGYGGQRGGYGCH